MTQRFQEWCEKNQIMVFKNEEMFFVAKTLVIRPDFRLLNRIFIDLIMPEEISESYLQGAEQFGQSHGTLIVIPNDILNDLDSITKEDMEKRFNITL